MIHSSKASYRILLYRILREVIHRSRFAEHLRLEWFRALKTVKKSFNQLKSKVRGRVRQ